MPFGAAVLAAARNLVVLGEVPVETGLQGVLALNPGEVVRNVRRVGQLAEGIGAARCEALSVLISEVAGDAVVPAEHVGKLRSERIVEQAGHLEAQLAGVHGIRIREDDRVGELGVGEHDFVGQRGAEYVNQVRAVDLRDLNRPLWASRIGQRDRRPTTRR